ncbi:carbohydrate ABC transporter permease [Phytoactinopolyspora endophytica]|uniref:carbohydrate ABC transporter permease n=1 Tax=Phytoactinopolyspora endophytica TaxID=1642495 RepID=UPI00101BE0E4|nr:carbohydrate ABC transporter permease [Phytoactinopolyspora endophytica]
MLFPRVGRKQPMLRIAWWAVVAFLCLGIALHLFPFYFMLVSSFKSGEEVLAFPPTFWPQDPSFAGWKLVFQIVQGSAGQLLDAPLWLFFWNSVQITFWVLVIGIPITSMAAYANSKLQRGPMARWSFLFFIGTLMMPAALTLIPNFLLTRNFPFALPNAPNIPGTDTAFPTFPIWDTHWAVIFPICFQAFNFLLFKGFFDTIPDSVIQAARVDGGSEFNIFRRIVLPMSVPVYAVTIWTAFSLAWDQFLWPLVVLQTPERMPMSVELYLLMERIVQSGGTSAEAAAAEAEVMQDMLGGGLSWNGLMVLAILQSLPVFIAFIVCREYLLRGIRLRGLK